MSEIVEQPPGNEDGEIITFDQSDSTEESDDRELVEEITKMDYDDEEEVEEEVEEEIPEWACAYCQNSDPTAVARCATCGRWFCNSYCRSGSHIVKHMIYSEHRSISLHPDGLQPDFVDTPIACFNNPQHTNIFTLGIIQNTQGFYSIICRDNCLDKSRLKELNWDADTWKHLVNERHVVSFLLNDEVADARSVIKVTDEEIRKLENLWKTRPEAVLADLRMNAGLNEDELEQVPLTFGSAKIYQSIFDPLIAYEERSDKMDNDSKCIEDVAIRWENGINDSKIAVFHNDVTDNRYRMNVGQMIKLHLPVSLLYTKEELVYKGKVILIEDSEVHVEMKDPSNLPLGQTSGFRVTFMWNSTSFQRMREAIKGLFYDTSMSEYLYNRLMGNPVTPHPVPLLPLSSFSVPNMPELNSSQIAAVQASLQNELTLIQGPPGTGKTLTSSSIVYHLVRGYKERVLVCAPSNIATDNLTLMIHKMGLNVVRVVARSRETVSSNVEKYCLHNMAPYVGGTKGELYQLNKRAQEVGQLSPREMSLYTSLMNKAELAILKAADVICCTCVMAGDPRIRRFPCQNVLIDEATQAREPECLIPIVNGCQRLILVGDHEQLGPVILDQKAKRAGFGMSLFERFLALDILPYCLNVQYRMHPALSEFCSNTFYNGELQNGIPIASRTRNIDFPWPRPDKPMMFWAMMGSEDPGSSGRSLQNRLEANAVEAVVARLLSCGIDGSRIAVITPYDSQRTLLRQFIQMRNSSNAQQRKLVEIASVDEFQGREKDYVVFSCVRSNTSGAIGFLKDYRRMNVALTRAKYGCIIVGNPSTLKMDPLWASLLSFYQTRKCLVSGATLDNLSHYMVHIKSVDCPNFYIDKYDLAKRRMETTWKYETANTQLFLGMLGPSLDGTNLKNVHSSIPESDIFKGIPEDMDIGETGISIVCFKTEKKMLKRGIEPQTFALLARRSNQLSYSSTLTVSKITI